MDVKEAFLKSLDKEFEEMLEIVSRNSYGKIYLTGSRIYKSAASELYDTEKPTGDWDFLIEEITEHKILPDGWELKQTGLGSPRFVNKQTQIDCVPMKNTRYIQRERLQPTIENFLAGSPLNIQFIAYDVVDETLYGDIGIDAILNKTGRVHNREEAELESKRKGMSIYQYAQSKTKGMNFKIVL